MRAAEGPRTTRPVTVHVPVPGGVVPVASSGLTVPYAPGLLVVPWYVPAAGGTAPVRRRFTLAHGASGRLIAGVPLCPHDTHAWADRASWIGVDWTADADVLAADGVAMIFAWRMCDEWRSECSCCLDTKAR